MLDWLIGMMLALAVFVLSTLSSYVLWPLVKFASWYLFYTLGAILLKILCKLRFEVYNEDLKLGQAECANRLVLVTGATSGIGLATALHLYRRGFLVVACYFSPDEPGYAQLNELTSGSPDKQRMHLVKLDVRSGESIEECYKRVRIIIDNNPGVRMHALLNVAGVGYFYKFQWTPRELIRNMVETNLLGPLLMTRQFVHLLIKCPGSRVVNVASPMAFIPAECNSVYGATKAGLTQFTNALEVELLQFGVKTCTIHPGHLVRNTAVLESSIKMKLDGVMPQLIEEEKVLYKQELEQYLYYMNKFEKNCGQPDRLLSPRRSGLRANLVRWAVTASGAVPEKRLNENDDFMQAFDNSVRLQNPPKEMFAGNCFFNLVSSSMFECLSRALCRDTFLILWRNGLNVVL